jgi:hypothetical protein
MEELESKLLYHWQSVSQLCLGIEYPCGTCDQILFPVGMLLSEICGLVSGGRPLWREDGSAICSVITQWSKSLRTSNHILLSHLRLLQPRRPGSRIYIPQEQGGPVIPPRALGYLYVVFCDLPLTSQSQSHFTTDGQSVIMSRYRAHSGTCDQILLSVRRLFPEICCLVFFWGALSDEVTSVIPLSQSSNLWTLADLYSCETYLIENAVFSYCCVGRLPMFATCGRFPQKTPTQGINTVSFSNLLHN